MGSDVNRHVFRHVDFVLDVEVVLEREQVAVADERVERILLPVVEFELQRAR